MDAAALAALVGLVAVTLLGTRAVAHPALARLRALFPSWRFFERAAGSPRLLVRIAPPGQALGDWLAVDGPPRRRRDALFAPAGNLALAEHAVVERLVAELGEHDGAAAIDELVSYELVTNLARASAPRAPAGAQLQWKVVAPDGDEPAEALISPVLTL